MPSFDKKIYNFYNSTTKETFQGIRKDFCHVHGITSKGASLIVTRQQDYHNGWTIVDEAFLDRVRYKKKYTISPKQRREADQEWDLAQSNLRQWQAKNGVHETITIRELKEKEEVPM